MTNITATSDYNLQKISTKDFSEHLKATIKFGGSLFVCGRRGSGKTFITKDAIEESKHKAIVLNASTFERVDAGGYPKLFNSTEKYVQYLLPEYYKDLIEGDDPCVIFFDEIDKTDPSVVASLLEIVQSHAINNKKMKNLKSVIMAGNLISEGSNRPPLPLLDRAEKYLLEPSYTHFLEWGSKTKEVHPSVAAFIADHPGSLVGQDDDNGELFSDESPRGWHNSSKIIFFGEKNHWPAKLILEKIAGCIGKRSGLQYSSYFEHYIELLPMAQSILNGEQIKNFNKLEQSRQMICSMVACTRFSNMLDDLGPKDPLPKASSYLARFLMSIDQEMALISIRSSIGFDRFIKHELMSNESDWDGLLDMVIKRMKS